ncbi:hypothetical protein BU17DRAFT_72215 [Hysterangium stoloniferum]|nr:hypothetical protein BU17DRAFT_72215 [Hysterangium stoloniferum]
MFAWGAVLVWGEIGGTVWEKIPQQGSHSLPPGSRSMGKSSCTSPSIRTTFPTVPSQLQPLLIVEKVPEPLSFAHCVLSKPTQGLEKETKKEMQRMQRDNRNPPPLSSNSKAISPKWKEAELDLGAPKLTMKDSTTDKIGLS